MDDRKNQLLEILSSIPKEILLHCAEIIKKQKDKKMSLETKRECVKVGNLRKIYGSDATLESWLKDPEHLYCGRPGRIFYQRQIFWL